MISTLMKLSVEAVVVGLVMASLKITTRLSVFWVGVIGHLLFELVGANKWYCKKGTACQ
tara:strand:- start:1827 stop:2003 length:177 start_codon:yes stop_codon:yes gene_type:complete